MSEQVQKRRIISGEDFIDMVNNPQMTSIVDVANALQIKPGTVKTRMVEYAKHGFQLRKLPMGTGAEARKNGLKTNPERLAALKERAERTFQAAQNTTNQ